ncbi:RNA polymerase sigma factor, sigma-70 family [Methylomagnum ishizawai]|uniref:RNA polymerase sigma factor, sigma-70 family n=1 Tax=Methylomagnum ishizawai TaxID=1760988 RepID=A0A1Y6D9P9_9GAMM|nr:response regulator [Methylomagnum ishizawai]SMF96455.1 RNA polymerase sigma factor, sigma-70 family [Methylomagnum ishizawai]
MTNPTSIFVIDDDPVIHEQLSIVLGAVGLAAENFASAEAFLSVCEKKHHGCILLDVAMPGMSGPELQAELAQRGVRLPIVYLSACEQVAIATQAIRGGAVDFLTKPVDPGLLIERVRTALAQEEERRERERANAILFKRLSVLTEREREVLTQLMRGHSNKEIARILGISHRTVEMHRSNILAKTDTANLLELARLAEACEFFGPHHGTPVA